MTNATFHNFDDKPFTGHWDGKPKTFKPGERVHMPSYLAEHFAKHLTNRYLIEHKMEVYTSPKNPGQVPQFMDVFRRAFIADAEQTAEDRSQVDVSPEISMNVEVKPMEIIDRGPAAALAEEAAPSGSSTIISPPAGDDDDASFDMSGATGSGGPAHIASGTGTRG